MEHELRKVGTSGIYGSDAGGDGGRCRAGLARRAVRAHRPSRELAGRPDRRTGCAMESRMPIRRRSGAWPALAVALTVIALAAGAGWLVQKAMPSDWRGVILLGALAWPLVALRSLRDHVAAVRDPLAAGDIDAARKAVSMIVGRDPLGSTRPHRARGNRKPRGEYIRRRGCAVVLGRAVRSARHRRLQGDQYARCDGRSWNRAC